MEDPYQRKESDANLRFGATCCSPCIRDSPEMTLTPWFPVHQCGCYLDFFAFQSHCSTQGSLTLFLSQDINTSIYILHLKCHLRYCKLDPVQCSYVTLHSFVSHVTCGLKPWKFGSNLRLGLLFYFVFSFSAEALFAVTIGLCRESQSGWLQAFGRCAWIISCQLPVSNFEAALIQQTWSFWCISR